MPYNTRRKSLSLPALGIQLPSGSRAHRPSISKPSQHHDADSPQHPSKRVKRSHTASSGSISSPVDTPQSAVSATPKTVTFADRPKSSGRNAYEHTPPPSPGPSHVAKIDKEGINDDLVVGVLEQLEKTGNRPHLIKELAAVLATSYDAVAGSANAPALLSSRLAAYMRRNWTALSPCPIAKELIPIHPRKVFYYLTTCPRQELPSSADDILPPTVVGGGKGKNGSKRIISPSLSNASQDDDDPSAVEDRKRAALSPSPEIDLSLDLEELSHNAATNTSTDFPTPPTPAGSSFSSARASLGREGSGSDRDLDLNRRAQSPRLERDEREFTATARGMRLSGLLLEATQNNGSNTTNDLQTQLKSEIEMDIVETEEEKAKHSSEAAATLFAIQRARGTSTEPPLLLSSPFSKPMDIQMPAFRKEAMRIKHEYQEHEDVVMDDEDTTVGKSFDDLWDSRGPEEVELDELDCLFEEY